MATDCLKSIYFFTIYFDNKILGTVITFDGLKPKKETGAFYLTRTSARLMVNILPFTTI